jgi:excisionase family DNA binding protein
MSTDLITIKEACCLLHLKDPGTVRRYIRNGRLDAVKAGRQWLVPRPQVERMLEPVVTWSNGSATDSGDIHLPFPAVARKEVNHDC